jgi:hypothetical protein
MKTARKKGSFFIFALCGEVEGSNPFTPTIIFSGMLAAEGI